MNPLDETSHRPWPVPKRPWMMQQVWRDLLFAHWPVPIATLRPLVPEVLPLDTFDGHAWVTVAPFHMDIRPRGLPALPGMSRIPELNCRTYVTVEGKPGVYFFSLDITSRFAVWGARSFYHLPYFHAQMHVEVSGAAISYSSRRENAVFRGRYAPISADTHRAGVGTGEYFLSERYCLYAVHGSRIYRGDIHHVPWPATAGRGGHRRKYNFASRPNRTAWPTGTSFVYLRTRSSHLVAGDRSLLVFQRF